jgi:4-amino-4-deoxy-L-arabinose transferase-like glycosyltransferase
MRAARLAWVLCIFFVLAGNLLIPYLGIENDEALFAQGLYRPRGELYSIHIGRSHVPIMLMTYLGALKSWVYGPVLKLFGISLATLRLPMLLAGAFSIWLFFLLLRRIAGDRAALIGCALLASDSLYLLTACFDWGPVALQHLLLAAGALLVVQFHQERRELALAAGFFFFGLAMWDKALAVWILSGLAIGGILTFPRAILKEITLRRAALAAAAFALGTLPLTIYNIENNGGTFHGNFQSAPQDLAGKALFLARSSSGAGLFGWMTAEDWETPHPHAPRNAVERAAARLSALAGHPRNSLLGYAFALALLLAPLAGWTNFRIVLWALIAMAVAWFQMAINQNTGGSIHHTILLWPLPQAIIAIAFAGASRRLGRADIAALSVVMAALVVSGVLVTNEYFVLMFRNGGAQAWNDGILNLSRYLRPIPASNYVFSLDWGIIDPLRLLDHGKLQLASVDPVFNPAMTPAEAAMVRQMIADPANLFIGHTAQFEVFKGNQQRLLKFAAENGYERAVIVLVPDSRGRNVYEVYSFQKAVSTK